MRVKQSGGSSQLKEPDRSEKHKRPEEPGRIQIRFCGFGGQGIVLAGMILGKAVTHFENTNAVMTQNYGPEARGGSCSADVIISQKRINYPRVTSPDILVLMSEEAARTYGAGPAPNALILLNENLVKNVPERADLRVMKVPATAIAEKHGLGIAANIVMLGFLCAVSGVVRPDSMKKAILSSIPPGSEKLNMAAFQSGYEHGIALYEKEGKREA